MSDNSSLNPEKLFEIQNDLVNFAQLLLPVFYQYRAENKMMIISNFIARSIMQLGSIIMLWKIGSEDDCQILYRSLLDRLLHLSSLEDTNSYNDFAKWCFIKRFEKANQLRSDHRFRSRFSNRKLKVDPEEKKLYEKYKKENVSWNRPKAEEILKKINYDYYYKYGYDIASSFVHPMEFHGSEDFFHITKGVPYNQYTDILHNSCLVTVHICHEGMNQSSLNWDNQHWMNLSKIYKLLNIELPLPFEK